MTAPEFDALVEKAARALCVANGEQPDVWDFMHRPWWTHWADAARAALTAAGVEDLLAEVERLRGVEADLRAEVSHLRREDVIGHYKAENATLLAEVERLREYDASLSEQIEEYIDANVDLLAERDNAMAEGAVWLGRSAARLVQRDALAAQVKAVREQAAWWLGDAVRPVADGSILAVALLRVLAPAQPDPDGANGAPGGRSVDEAGK